MGQGINSTDKATSGGSKTTLLRTIDTRGVSRDVLVTLVWPASDARPARQRVIYGRSEAVFDTDSEDPREAVHRWGNFCIAEIRGHGELTTAEQIAAALSGVVDIADGVELAAHASRERALATDGWQLVDLAHHEGAAMAANRIACAVRDLLAGQGESAEAYVAPLREQLAAATARAEAAERERDVLRDQLAAVTDYERLARELDAAEAEVQRLRAQLSAVPPGERRWSILPTEGAPLLVATDRICTTTDPCWIARLTRDDTALGEIEREAVERLAGRLGYVGATVVPVVPAATDGAP